MTEEYVQAFVHESEEQLTDLNNSLLALESDPDDQEAMDDIFRTAHTLKGNFGAMGYDEASDLAHAIEDLLDELREDEMAVTPEVMDLVFAGVDRLELAVESIDEDGTVDVETGDLEEDIRTVIENGGATGGDATAADDTAAADAETGQVDTFDVTVEIGDTEMKGVDGMLVLEAIREECDLVSATPEPDAIEDGEYEGGFDLVVASTTADELRATLDRVSAIDGATLSQAGSDEAANGESDTASTEPDADDTQADDAESDDSGSDSDTGGKTGESNGSSREISSVRVDVDQLDDLHGLVEQLVTSRIKLRRAVGDGDVGSATDTLGELDKITGNLQNTVMDMRLIPMRKVISKFPRLVRDLAREQEKEIDFRMEGQDIELDRTILTEISDPLMHILRNAVDHGIEPPAEREAAGKDREGTIELRASRERDHVTVTVEDDGRGLDVDELRRKALEKGVRTEAELDAMEDTEVYDLVFHPGFSTADEVTDVSGRGVGMDVVHSTVKQLDGSVNVESEKGEGTTVTLRLPVTVAIVKVLFIEVGNEEYGVPIKNIDEVSRMPTVETINDQPMIEHDEEIYPVVDLASELDVPGQTANGDSMLLRIRKSERRTALRCDAVNKQEEVVVKPLEGVLSGIPGLSGTAVLGDGNIVPILDVVTL
ncbi:chemotaxis protein CheA [Haloplanus aerogenes]|uniref:Chemotaxis protein CheA n=1 Tax=Haloplanus aerogenes TaxID=660522 RepID=A0A3M0DY59_9EURY|nr:chemotaxis protein CheA [Haloplanus aerogenes]AZH25320.1 chemotaxis protein CheA [Haloplanus aerogenes]RMB25016.1 two-component system chemotaxis sensor kinase CheA [Haloplanus aerogenes]